MYEKDSDKCLDSLVAMGVLVPGGDRTAVRRTADFFLSQFTQRLEAQVRGGGVGRGGGVAGRLWGARAVCNARRRAVLSLALLLLPRTASAACSPSCCARHHLLPSALQRAEKAANADYGSSFKKPVSGEEKKAKRKAIVASIGEDLLVASADKPFRFPATFTCE